MPDRSDPRSSPHISRTRNEFIEYVKYAAMNEDPTCLAWYKVFADLTPYQRKRVNLDDVCFAASVRPSQLLAAVVGHGVEAQQDMGNLVGASFHPKLVAAAGKSG